MQEAQTGVRVDRKRRVGRFVFAMTDLPRYLCVVPLVGALAIAFVVMSAFDHVGYVVVNDQQELANPATRNEAARRSLRELDVHAGSAGADSADRRRGGGRANRAARRHEQRPPRRRGRGHHRTTTPPAPPMLLSAEAAVAARQLLPRSTRVPVDVCFLALGAPTQIDMSVSIIRNIEAQSVNSTVSYHLLVDKSPSELRQEMQQRAVWRGLPIDRVHLHTVADIPRKVRDLYRRLSHSATGPGPIYLYKPLLHLVRDAPLQQLLEAPRIRWRHRGHVTDLIDRLLLPDKDGRRGLPLRDTQRHSEALRGTQRPSEAIRGNGRDLPAQRVIGGNQWPSEASRGNGRDLPAVA